VSFKARSEDYSTILYLVPFVAAVIYGLVEWVLTGLSLELPTSVYLTVTRDPYLFVLGSLAVMLGLIIEVNGTDPAARPAKLSSLAGTLQSLAVASLVLVLFFAWYANGFIDLAGAASVFIVGRYGLVFPAILILMSYLISSQIRIESFFTRKSIGLIALLLVPASLYEVGRRNLAAGVGVALILLLAGLGIFLSAEKKPPAEEE
jgi:hypothetical protein